MREYRYAIAYFDRRMGTVSTYIKMSMDGVEEGAVLPTFLESAGKKGWLLCAMMDTFLKDGIRTIQAYPEEFAKATGKRDRDITDPSELLELIFVKEV